MEPEDTLTETTQRKIYKDGESVIIGNYTSNLYNIISNNVSAERRLIWIGDPCYVLGNDPNASRTDDKPYDTIGNTWEEFKEKLNHTKDAIQFNFPLGHAGAGVCVLADYCDLGIPFKSGKYPAKVTYHDDRIQKVEIILFESNPDYKNEHIKRTVKALEKEYRAMADMLKKLCPNTPDQFTIGQRENIQYIIKNIDGRINRYKEYISSAHQDGDIVTSGHCGVDSGLIYIGDPGTFIGKDPNALNSDDRPLASIGNTWDEFTDNMINKTIYKIPEVGGPNDVGICIQAGYGDGTYPVNLIYHSGCVQRIEMVFFNIDDCD